jgi:competence protein ComEC
VQERVPWWLRPAAALVLSSVVAGMATGPIAAAHFNRVAEYGLLANLLAVPVMGLVVMPAGVLAALAAPFGLASLPLWVMGKGTEVILLIAAWVAGMEGAVRAVPAPHPLTLALFGLGGAAVILGPRRVRASGVAVAVAGLALWTVAERPQVLIASDGGLVGVMTEGGRALSKPKGAGFVAESWLEDDGDAADQEAAFARGTFSGEKGQVSGVTGGVTFWHLTGKTAAERAVPLCAGSAVVVIGVEWDGEKPGGCTLIDALGLRATGALALEVEGGALTVTSAREVSGDRLWNTRPARPERERRYAQGQ